MSGKRARRQETGNRKQIEVRTAPPCSQCFSAESFTVTLLRYNTLTAMTWIHWQ